MQNLPATGHNEYDFMNDSIVRQIRVPQKREASGEFAEGIYSFQNEETGKYLAHLDNRTAFISQFDRNTCLWDVKETHLDYDKPVKGKTSFKIYTAGDHKHLLDIHNAWMYENSTVKIWTQTGYLVQHWYITYHADHSVSIISCDQQAMHLN